MKNVLLLCYCTDTIITLQIELDFQVLHPEKALHLLSQWPEVAGLLKDLVKKRVKDSSTLQVIKGIPDDITSSVSYIISCSPTLDKDIVQYCNKAIHCRTLQMAMCLGSSGVWQLAVNLQSPEQKRVPGNQV